MPDATGTVATGEHGPELVLQRKYDLPVETVWEHVTKSELLETWIGRWGDRAGHGQAHLLHDRRIQRA